MEESPNYPAVPGRSAMPRFISQKVVSAVQIGSIDQAPADQERVNASGDWLLIPATKEVSPITVSHEWIAKHKPEIGGYYVVYADGYPSYSPKQAFEAGNTPVGEWGLQLQQEPKFGTGERGRIVNRSSGQPIPDFEPVFILRGQDKLSAQTLVAYRNMIMSAGVDPSSIDERIEAFNTFAIAFQHRMKYPDGVQLQDGLQPYQRRVVLERGDYKARLSGLLAFIASPAFEDLDLDERKRLSVQSGLMQQLVGVLNERIAAFQPAAVPAATVAEGTE